MNLPGNSGPRCGKKEFTHNIINQQVYDRWIDLNPDANISYKRFLEIWKIIADKIKREIVENPMGVRLSHMCGEMRIQYLPKSVKAQNYFLEEKEERPNYLNINSKGKVAKIMWIRKNAVKFNPFIMYFGYEQHKNLNQQAYDFIMKSPELYRSSGARWIKPNNSNE